MINVLINGCNGKMGQEIANLVHSSHSFCLIGGISKQNSKSNFFNVFTHFSQIPQKPDVIIDFSTPIGTFNILEYSKRNKIPLVIATTGFTPEQNNKIFISSKLIPIFKSANMSYSIAVVCNLLKQLAEFLPNSEIEILETHHSQKLDSPSGTAIMLADSINKGGNYKFIYNLNRNNCYRKRLKNEIGISSIRGGNIVGEHSVFFFDESEILELKHTALSRKTFAEGALRAAKFIVKQKPGKIYTMEDLLSAKGDGE